MDGIGDRTSPTRRTAVVVGATGLVGQALIEQLLEDTSYERIVTLGRRSERPIPPGAVSHLGDKVSHHRIDFETPEAWAPLVQGDVLFSMLGTTLKAAGSQEAQFRVDHDYQLFAARAARENGVSTYVLVSAAGASERSRMFYSHMKGQLEREVLGLRIPKTTILRPGILDGNRKESRPGERAALAVLRHLPKLPALAKARAVHVSVVARACRVAAVENPDGVHLWEARDIFDRGSE